MATRLSVWDPVRETLTLRDAMDRLFEESFVPASRVSGGRRGMFVPSADAWEDVDAVVIELALAGADPGSVDVTVEQDSLLVTGQMMARDEEKNWVLTERPRGGFQRRFSLNVPVDADAVEATFGHGVLTLRLPKREETKPRKIAVTVAES